MRLAETDVQVERLEQVFASIDETPKGKTCDAIMGIFWRVRAGMHP
jgi:ferritin-like metal-binding protein YciE